MYNKSQNDILVKKIENADSVYEQFLIAKKHKLKVFIFETADKYDIPPVKAEYKPINTGELWGGNFCYAYFKIDEDLPPEFNNAEKFLYNENGATENLIFRNGVPAGMFDYIENAASKAFRGHKYFRLLNDENHISYILEGYSSHRYPGTGTFDVSQIFALTEQNEKREFNGIFVITKNPVVDRFLDNLYLIKSLNRALDEKNYLKYEIYSLYEKLFVLLSLKPGEEDLKVLPEASKLIEEFLTRKDKPYDNFEFGLIGHSHLDTAWLWKTEETKKKAARTVSNAVAMLERYKEYTFVFSSTLHLEWIKYGHPELFEKVKKYVKEGRFEPAGGSFVEPDCNITGSEAFVRQFIFGQNFLKENFGIRSDVFWLPDTFGYSASMPQILNLSGITKFYTTKLEWGESNKPARETFNWRGIDRKAVVKTHFNTIHCYADPGTLIDRKNNIRDKYNTNKALISYGFGDGGGGPFEKMIEYAIKVKDVVGVPKSCHTTTSKFMNTIDGAKLPEFYGELYVEAHRGTLTSNHIIKRLNRKLEIALHDADYMAVIFNKPENKQFIDKQYKILLQNQFHDILPGTCIKEAHDIAIAENETALKETNGFIHGIIASQSSNNGKGITLINTLSFDRYDVVMLDGAQDFPGACTYKDLDGNTKTDALYKIEAFGVSSRATFGDFIKSEFTYKNNTLITPLLEVRFDKNMNIISLFDKPESREISDGKINYFTLGEDVPSYWDNWDVEPDYILKQKPCGKLVSSEVIINSGIEFRLRNVYTLSEKTTLYQDVIFYAHTKRVDFECKLDWNDQYKLLKVNFDTNIVSASSRHEIQFGCIERPLSKNNTFEQAKFEVSNHKYTDISETNYGFAILNDCKYAVNCNVSSIALTLMKAGGHPDDSFDPGVKYFKYAILPHSGGFSAETVVKPAYMFNYPPIIVSGEIDITPLCKINRPNIICETVKISEDGTGTILRFYECEGTRTGTEINLNKEYEIYETNFLEDITKKYGKDKNIEMTFSPFEIKTLLLK